MSDRQLTMMRKSGRMMVPVNSKDGKAIQPYAFVHYCVHPDCFELGSFGFRVSILNNEPGTWYCRAHLPPEKGF